MTALDLPSAPTPMLGMRLAQVRQIVDSLRQQGPDHAPARTIKGPGAIFGARQYLSPDEGEGYWDVLAVRPGLFLSITSARYERPVRMHLPAEPVAKVRIMLSGAITDTQCQVASRAGEVSLECLSGRTPNSYWTTPGLTPLRMLTLHIKPRALRSFGFTEDALAPALRALASSQMAHDCVMPIANGHVFLRIAQDIFLSKDQFSPELRMAYVAAKAEEILCYALEAVRPHQTFHAGANRISRGDLQRLRQAQEILRANVDDLPTLAQLARAVGLNESKLKAGFREMFGEPPHGFAARVRLETALCLIQNSELAISEVAYRVGYRHSANFSQAFRRQFGVTPRQARQHARSK